MADLSAGTNDVCAPWLHNQPHQVSNPWRDPCSLRHSVTRAQSKAWGIRTFFVNRTTKKQITKKCFDRISYSPTCCQPRLPRMYNHDASSRHLVLYLVRCTPACSSPRTPAEGVAGQPKKGAGGSSAPRSLFRRLFISQPLPPQSV
jgi:hypothetical protein